MASEYLTVKKHRYYSLSFMLNPKGDRSLSASHRKVASSKLGSFMWDLWCAKR